jgi:hypothetical protein
MAVFLFTPNDTCDIYRGGNMPPSAPNVAGVKILVVPRFRNIRGDFAGLFKYCTFRDFLIFPTGRVGD